MCVWAFVLQRALSSSLRVKGRSRHGVGSGPSGSGGGEKPRHSDTGRDILGSGLTCWDAMPAPTNWFSSSQITEDGAVKKKKASAFRPDHAIFLFYYECMHA